MKNYLDGGEAILEAFRKLKIDYIMSSPGSEWSPVWEALARQKLDRKPGPTFVESWHETLAVNMATGYTLITGRPQAVLLHAAVGMLQGSVGVHGALQNEVPMVVMSGESQSLGEDPDLDIEQQWYGGLSVGGIERFVEPVAKWARAVTSPHTLHESVIRAGEMAQRVPKGPIYLNVALEHMLHDWTPPAAAREVPPAPTVQARPEDVDADRRAAARREEPGHRGRSLRTRPQGICRAGRARRPARHPGDQRARQRLRKFSDRSPALPGRGQVQGGGRRRPGPAGGRARALVSGAPAADQRQDRRDPRQPAQGSPHLSELALGPLPRGRHRDVAQAAGRAGEVGQGRRRDRERTTAALDARARELRRRRCAPSRRRRGRERASIRSRCWARSAR